MIGLCQAKAANQLTLCKLGDVFFLLLLCAIGIDWPHDKAGLNTHGRPVAAVHSKRRGKLYAQIYTHTLWETLSLCTNENNSTNEPLFFFLFF